MKNNEVPPPSPCIQVCVMDEFSGLCRGCYRTLEEISAWGALNKAQKSAILAELDKRTH